jgi:hypothetical protein
MRRRSRESRPSSTRNIAPTMTIALLARSNSDSLASLRLEGASRARPHGSDTDRPRRRTLGRPICSPARAATRSLGAAPDRLSESRAPSDRFRRPRRSRTRARQAAAPVRPAVRTRGAMRGAYPPPYARSGIRTRAREPIRSLRRFARTHPDHASSLPGSGGTVAGLYRPSPSGTTNRRFTSPRPDSTASLARSQEGGAGERTG